jgi:hypothetical protein
VLRLAERLRRLPPIGGGAAVGLAAIALFIILWFPVITGQRVLLGGDVLYQVLPWSAEPGAHPPANIIVSDPMLQMLPWQQLVVQDFEQGILPLWNPTAQNGAPLLANDQSAAFSPFTWLALPFPPAIGLSLAMLAKILVAGLGMALYLRALKTSGAAAALGGIAYASSSFMIVWLAWPHSAVAALFPWAFACAEQYLVGERSWPLPALALVVAVQFLAGHAETSLHMGLALGVYVLVRWALSDRRWRKLGGLAVAASVGTLLAAIQLVPFLDLLRNATLASDRAVRGVGFAHLNLGALSSWVFPNLLGNPSLDGLPGRFPNYNESTGYVGVASLALSPLGAWRAWSRERSVAVALVGLGLVSAGIVYGPLAPLAGRVPGLAVSSNPRLLVVICFCLAALGGLGLDALLHAPISRSANLWAKSNWLGTAGLAAVAAAGLAVALRGRSVDHWLPPLHGYISFWLLVGAASVMTACAFVAAGLLGGNRRWAVAGLCTLALIEAAIFAGPFNPREPLNEVPPPSPSVAWLQAHAGGRPIAALGTTLIPETASLYGLTDARSYDVLIDPRQRIFWSAADQGYGDSNLIMTLERPGVDWLATAGVAYVMMPADQSLPGATTVYNQYGVAIAEVPNPRPFVYTPTEVLTATDPRQAAALLSSAPLGPVVVEGCCPVVGSAQAHVTRRTSGEVDLTVTADSRATIVVQQSYRPGWEADIDGRPTEILPANVLFQAITVPAGQHLVTFRYRPASVPIGAALTAIGVAGLVVLAVLPLALRRRARSR